MRRLTIRWPAANNVRKAARVGRFINPKSGREAWHSKCSMCQSVRPDSQMELDHVVPVVPIEGPPRRKDNDLLMDWNVWLDRAYVFEEGWRVLCESCHYNVTQKQNDKRARFKSATPVEELTKKNKRGKSKITKGR